MLLVVDAVDAPDAPDAFYSHPRLCDDFADKMSKINVVQWFFLFLSIYVELMH